MKRALLIAVVSLGLIAAPIAAQEPPPAPDRPLADAAQEARAHISSAATSTTTTPSTPPKKPPTTKGGGNPTPTVDTKIEASEGSTALETGG